MTPDRLVEIRNKLATGWFIGFSGGTINELVAELDAVTKERDEARKELGPLRDIFNVGPDA